MPWYPAWSKINKQELARYVTPAAANKVTLPRGINHFDIVQKTGGPDQLVRLLYNALLAKSINYTWEEHQAEESQQFIRTPTEVLEIPGEGTCLDLTTTFCGVCLGYGLLPLILIFQDHACAAISRTHGRAQVNSPDRPKQGLFQGGVLTGIDNMQLLIKSGAYLPIECTGFARSETLAAAVPEGQDREVDGTLVFIRALRAGEEQLTHPLRSFCFALDIAVLHDAGIAPLDSLSRDNSSVPVIGRDSELKTASDIQSLPEQNPQEERKEPSISRTDQGRIAQIIANLKAFSEGDVGARRALVEQTVGTDFAARFQNGYGFRGDGSMVAWNLVQALLAYGDLPAEAGAPAIHSLGALLQFLLDRKFILASSDAAFLGSMIVKYRLSPKIN